VRISKLLDNQETGSVIVNSLKEQGVPIDSFILGGTRIILNGEFSRYDIWRILSIVEMANSYLPLTYKTPVLIIEDINIALGTQEAVLRVLTALKDYPAWPMNLASYSYDQAQLWVMDAYSKGLITQDDKNRIFSAFPEGTVEQTNLDA
jgi:hypothetical protein